VEVLEAIEGRLDLPMADYRIAEAVERHRVEVEVAAFPSVDGARGHLAGEEVRDHILALFSRVGQNRAEAGPLRV
jgi:hypothetical protein